MAGMKISELDVLDTLSGDEKLVVAKGGDNYGVTVETLLSKVPWFEDQLSYGIEYDTTVSSPQCTRIGNVNYHRSLPIHSKMKGCLLSDDGTVQKYLDPNTWVNETRDGSQGQVMVEIPSYYRKFETEGTKRRVRISEMPLPGYHLVKKKYVSAYEASVKRSTTTLCSVVNEDPDYRGGNNQAVWDNTYRTVLGRPATAISRTNFRAYARKRKEGSSEWNCMTYDIQKDLFWLFAIEYANLNSQAAFNSEKDSNGFSQGGLGPGVTTLNSTEWNNYNGNYPFVPCGHTDSLGNKTGYVNYNMMNETGEVQKTVQVPRYRGVENPFGHTWTWTDGVNVRISPTEENGGDNLSKVFVTDDPSLFNDTNYEGYRYMGNEARTSGFVKSVLFGEGGEIMAETVGGGSTTYFCDYHYTDILTIEQLNGVVFGGRAADIGGAAGLVYSGSTFAPSITAASAGSRLCFIPE
jgi:hypothetical protein